MYNSYSTVLASPKPNTSIQACWEWDFFRSHDTYGHRQNGAAQRLSVKIVQIQNCYLIKLLHGIKCEYFYLADNRFNLKNGWIVLFSCDLEIILLIYNSGAWLLDWSLPA